VGSRRAISAIWVFHFHFHFQGTAGGEVLAAAIEAEAGTGAFPVIAAGPFAVVLADPAFARVPRLPLPGLEAALRGSTARRARLLGMGPHHCRLPPEELDGPTAAQVFFDCTARLI
jgi:hypothetical protein